MKKSKKNAGLGQEIDFDSTKLHIVLRWPVNGAATLCICSRKECNKLDLTAAQYFRLAHHHTDWSRWFAIRSPPPICCVTV
jgi:hypothetical protein